MRGSRVSITVGSTKYPSVSSTFPPTSTSVSAVRRASSIASRWPASAFSSITAPMKFEKSATSPILIAFTSSASRSRSSGHRFDGA
jgi:hypothetical protein